MAPPRPWGLWRGGGGGGLGQVIGEAGGGAGVFFAVEFDLVDGEVFDIDDFGLGVEGEFDVVEGDVLDDVAGVAVDGAKSSEGAFDIGEGEVVSRCVGARGVPEGRSIASTVRWR